MSQSQERSQCLEKQAQEKIPHIDNLVRKGGMREKQRGRGGGEAERLDEMEAFK